MKRGLVLLGVLVACRKGGVTGAVPVPDGSSAAQAQASPSQKAWGAVAARCRASGPGAALDDGGGLDDLVVGDGLAYAEGYAIGIIHRSQDGRTPAIALLGPEPGEAKVMDLPPTLGDAPPPRTASCGKDLVAGEFRLPAGTTAAGGGRREAQDLGLYAINPRLPPQLIFSVAQRRDDSLAFDLACSERAALVVWDETRAGTPGTTARGVVRAAAIDVSLHTGGAHDLSPADSDVELPRVVSNGSGFFVVWLARRQEISAGGDSPHALSGRGQPGLPTDIEALGEVRSYGWLEMVNVNAAGNAVGPVRRLTPSSGHVSAFDIESANDGPKPRLLVVARDDAELVDGTGGMLLRLHASEDGADPPEPLPLDGLGRGAPSFVEGKASSWLAWVGSNERLRLVPLDAAGEVAGPVSVEDGLDEARPLLILGGDSRVLVAAPRDKSAQLRAFTCQR